MNNNVTSAGTKVDSSTKDELLPSAPLAANPMLYAAFSVIPLDIEGSNISAIGCVPTDDYLNYMSADEFEALKREGEAINEKVLFKNVSLQYDSCDCSDGMCSHGSWVYEVIVNSEGKRVSLEMEEDTIYFQNDSKSASMPIANATIFDFYRMCEIVGIKLELSSYALALCSV